MVPLLIHGPRITLIELKLSIIFLRNSIKIILMYLEFSIKSIKLRHNKLAKQDIAKNEARVFSISYFIQILSIMESENVKNNAGFIIKKYITSS